MKPLVIYHDNCSDGFGAAFAAWMKFGDNAEYLPVSYGKDYSKSENTFPIHDREVYILDFSFPREVMDTIFRFANRVVWLDHHKTAFEMWCERYEKGMVSQALPIGGERHLICLDDNRSGALIAWEYFHPTTPVPKLIQHIDDYDRWQFKIEGTKAFNKALWSYVPWSFEQWKGLNSAFNMWHESHHYDQFINEGEALLRAHEQNVQAVVKDAATGVAIQWDFKEVAGTVGYREVCGLAANCPPHLASDVGHELANRSGTFGLVWSLNKDRKCQCSLRSNGDYDVSAIAKAFGGGGHRNAAGFEVSIGELLDWLK